MTPIARVAMVIGGRPGRLLLKLEGHSPSGSIKGRTARSLVEALEAEGRVWPGATLVESTSGNLGVGLALVAAARGYRLHAVVDPSIPRSALMRMRRLGAVVEIVREPDGNGSCLPARLARVHELCGSSRRFVWTDQYGSAANPRAHETGTGPEIAAQAGPVDAVFAAVSTGGTAAGLARFFRSTSPATRTIGVDVQGSAASGGRAGPRVLTGIGSARRSRFLVPGLLHDVVVVREEDAVEACRDVACRTGIRVGGSSGAVVAACVGYLEANPEIRDAVCVCADGGENYVETVYDDGWVGRHFPSLALSRRPSGSETA